MTQTRRRLSLVLQPLAVLVVAVVAATAVGWLAITLLTAGSDGSNGWADLGAVVMGMLVGVVAGLAVWVAGLVWLARRLFPRGRRAGAVVLALAFAAVLFTVALQVESIPGPVSEGSDVLATIVVLLVAGAPSIVFLLCDRRSARRASVQELSAPSPFSRR